MSTIDLWNAISDVQFHLDKIREFSKAENYDQALSHCSCLGSELAHLAGHIRMAENNSEHDEDES